MKKTLKKMVIRLLLGRKKKELFTIVPLKGRFYVLKIYPHEPADEFIARMEKALQKQGLET